MSGDQAEVDPVARFAGYVATLGRGPGRSRALTRAEAFDALSLALADRVHPAQLGAFLMLLRYRGEDADEIAGLVDAARAEIRATHDLGAIGVVDLDWPSYGAGRTREAPWFLLSALALAQKTGRRVLMHGSNAFGSGLGVADGLTALGLSAAVDAAAIGQALERDRFAYWPADAMAPGIASLLDMRALFGLRSPINTVARLIDPGDAGVSVDGVFHPPYIALHLAVAERLSRRALVVIKGGGGEAERTPFKPVAAHRWYDGAAQESLLPALAPAATPVKGAVSPEAFAALWSGETTNPGAEHTVVGTIALALLALEPRLAPGDADAEAVVIWRNRRALA